VAKRVSGRRNLEANVRRVRLPYTLSTRGRSRLARKKEILVELQDSAKWHRSASRSPSLNPVAFAQTSRAVPPNLAKVILNTIRRLERPQDFSGTTKASSLVQKAAQAIVQLTQERNPPLRLLLGSDAYGAAEKNDLARLEEARIWKKLSVSTDFETK
jgi:hypothetical protein